MYTLKSYSRVEVQIYALLISELESRECSALPSTRFSPIGKASVRIG